MVALAIFQGIIIGLLLLYHVWRTSVADRHEHELLDRIQAQAGTLWQIEQHMQGLATPEPEPEEAVEQPDPDAMTPEEFDALFQEAENDALKLGGI